jgi:hypothetical protein
MCGLKVDRFVYNTMTAPRFAPATFSRADMRSSKEESYANSVAKVKIKIL